MSVKSVQAIINGQTHTLTYNEGTQRYEATITAPSKSSYQQAGHYYGIQIKATDDANNVTTADQNHETLGENLRLKVKEKVAPTITISSPTDVQLTSQAKPQISWNVMDNDSGVNPATIGITIDSNQKITGDKIQKSQISGGYQCTYTPETALDDGSHTIHIDASDNDGNVAQRKSVTFRVLATAPNISVISPAEGSWTNKATVSFSGTTDAAGLTVKVGSGSAKEVNISEGKFSGTVTLTQEGENTITFVARNEAGVETTITRKVKLDTKAPQIISATITPNPVDAGKTFVISVEVTD